MDVMSLTPEQLREMIPDDDLDAYFKASGMPTLADLNKLPNDPATEQLRHIFAGMRDDQRRLMIHGITYGFPKQMPPEVQGALDKIKAVSDWAKKLKVRK